MLFNTPEFIFIFLPITLAGYFLALRALGNRAAIVWLGAASFAFFLFGEHTYPWLLPLSVAVNYLFGRWIGAAEQPRRKWLAAAGIGLNIALLCAFKYANFLADQLHLIGLIPARDWRIVLPIGISFFTFTQIAYLADVYGRAQTEKKPANYFLFVTYFPHLIAGPILHHKEMMPQFDQRPTHVRDGLFAGVVMFAIGLAKKTLIADPAGMIASEIFGKAGHSEVGFLLGWIGAVSYAVQIYFDFSGYSDMAIGMSQLFGIKLPINFNSPYKSQNIVEFWRRWHITLSRFLRDYLYIPLGGSRCGPVRHNANLLVTMVLGGLWHGAGWTFMIWGALHGTALVIAHLWGKLRSRLGLPSIPAPIGWLLTITFVIVAWAPFRAPDLQTALSMWRGMGGLDGLGFPALGPLRGIGAALGVQAAPVDFDLPTVLTVCAGALLAIVAPNSQQLLQRFSMGLSSPGYGELAPVTRWRLGWNLPTAVFAGLILGVSIRAFGSYSEFIYFQF